MCDTLHWKHGMGVLAVPEVIMRCNVFLMYRKLAGYFPVCSWLWVATVFIKCRTTMLAFSWVVEITDNSLKLWLGASRPGYDRTTPYGSLMCELTWALVSGVSKLMGTLHVGCMLVASRKWFSTHKCGRPWCQFERCQHGISMESNSTASIYGFCMCLWMDLGHSHWEGPDVCKSCKWNADLNEAWHTRKAGRSVDVMLVKSYRNQMDKLSRLLQRWRNIKKGLNTCTMSVWHQWASVVQIK